MIDKRIYACNLPFKLSLEEIAKELEINGNKQKVKKAITKVIENLNGYKINEKNEIKIIFDKETKKIILL
jgi:predicted DNA-binding protein YlxM (UPF0122 family)